MGGTRDSENAETLDSLGLVQECLSHGCDWQYPLTVNQNPEVARRVQEIWALWETKRDFGMNDQDWQMPTTLRGPYDRAIFDFIARLPLPFDRATNRFRKREDTDQNFYQDEYQRLLGTVEADIQRDGTSLAHQLHTRIVQDYATKFPDLDHNLVNNAVALVKKLLHVAHSAYGNEICDSKTLKQFFTHDGPVSGYSGVPVLGLLEIEFECKPEMSCEPVSGIYLGWPVRRNGNQWEYLRYTIVRQVKRWRIVLNHASINRMLQSPDELLKAKELMSRLSKIRPMFVAQGTGFQYNGFDNDPLRAYNAQETNQCNLINFLDVGNLPGPLAGNRVPFDRYWLVRNDELLTSPRFVGFMDCKATKQRWRELNQKRRLCSVFEQVRSDTYAPGKPGADRAVEEFEGINNKEIPKGFVRYAKAVQREQAQENARKRAIEMARDRAALAAARDGEADPPPFLSQRSRSRSRHEDSFSSSHAGGVPSVARLKL